MPLGCVNVDSARRRSQGHDRSWKIQPARNIHTHTHTPPLSMLCSPSESPAEGPFRPRPRAKRHLRFDIDIYIQLLMAVLFASSSPSLISAPARGRAPRLTARTLWQIMTLTSGQEVSHFLVAIFLFLQQFVAACHTSGSTATQTHTGGKSKQFSVFFLYFQSLNFAFCKGLKS